MSVVDTLTAQQKEELVKLAIQTASDHSYCSETTTVLEAMGFAIEPTTQTIRIEVEVLMPIGRTIDPDQYDIYLYDSEGDYLEYESIEITAQE